MLLLLYKSVLLAQWENKCISLRVLSVARVMTAQWENEYINIYHYLPSPWPGPR